MATDDDAKQKMQPKSVVSSPSTRVTIAFPFSNIKLAEPSAEVAELADIVAALAEHVAVLRPSPETAALFERAEALVHKLA